MFAYADYSVLYVLYKYHGKTKKPHPYIPTNKIYVSHEFNPVNRIASILYDTNIVYTIYSSFLKTCEKSSNLQAICVFSAWLSKST